MKIIGFNITKINAQKENSNSPEVQVNTKIDVKNIVEAKSDFFKTKEELLTVSFVFGFDYKPDVAKIEIEGVLVLAVDSKTSKDVLKQWKDKKMPENFQLDLFNMIISKATLKALELENDLGLPPHLRFPSVKKKDP